MTPLTFIKLTDRIRGLGFLAGGAYSLKRPIGMSSLTVGAFTFVISIFAASILVTMELIKIIKGVIIEKS